MEKRPHHNPATRQVVRLGALSSDPSACDSFHAFDPESGIVYPAIADSLVYIDCAGAVQPGLAVTWRRVDPLTMEFDLREGVRFHNGDAFSADDVVATFKAHLDPANRSGQGQGILSVIADCERISDYRVRLRTAFPDGMLLNRLHIASAVYPRSILEREGPGALHRHPIGTGAYAFKRWRKGDEIVLTRNPEHWSGLVTIDELVFPIMDQKDWVDALAARQLDIAINLDPHDARRIMELGSEQLVLRRREAALSHWFLLSQRGPLADKRVRLALNYAVHRHLLCQISNHGWASPQASLLTPGQVGYDAKITPYPYDPDHAQQLLAEAGYARGFTLRGLVSESCASVYRLVRVFLENVGVRLEADIVPRPEWLARVVTARIREGKPYDGDFALANVDNFTLHGLFHHAIFLFSQGVFSLTQSPDYDAKFLETAVQIEPAAMQRALAGLDRYAYDEALMLYTIRTQVCCGLRRGYDIPIGVSGHFNYDNLWRIRVDEGARPEPPEPLAPKLAPEDAGLRRILDSTVYPGILYDQAERGFEDPVHARLWRNIQLHEERWMVLSQEMLRTAVDQVTVSTHLENVLRSTQQVGILGITYDGRILFENSGYRKVMGHTGSEPLPELLRDDAGELAWSTVEETTAREGACSGVFNVISSDGTRRRVFLTATPAINELGSQVGYTCIFTDHSKEEERLRVVQEMEVAERIQLALLPMIQGASKQTTAATMIPADEVGGDYYDIIRDERGHTWYGIGDVSGHGVTSGLIMLMTHCIIRTIIRANQELSMEAILTQLNRVLYEDIQLLGESHHLTFGLLKGVGDGDYEVAGAHEDILIHRAATGRCERVPLPGIFFGFVPDISGIFESRVIHLDPGDTMVLYTDGVIEAENSRGDMWEVEAFIESITRHAHLAPDAMKAAILSDLKRFMDKQLDDITMMIIRRSA